MQKINNAIDSVRKSELRKARLNKDQNLINMTNCKQRFILLKKSSNLTEKQTLRLEELCEINEPIYKSLLLKNQFLAIYKNKTEHEAELALREWFVEALDSGISAFVDVSRKLLMKVNFILNWFKKRISSAISEGINNKVKRLKRMAYGYRDVDYFRLKIHQHCGLLNPKRFDIL